MGGFRFQTIDGKKQVSTDGGSTWSNFNSGAGLLWTNPAPSTSFGAQTITIDLSNYDAAIVSIKEQITDSEIESYQIIPIPCNSFNLVGSINNTTRFACSISETGIQFTSRGSVNNEYCIPIKIYGCIIGDISDVN